MSENWKVIEGFPYYAVSDLGRVRRIIKGKSHNRLGVLKPRPAGRKPKAFYLYVALHQDRKAHERSVHILVAKAFVPNPEGLPEVNHIDGVKFNCRADNLEWRDHQGNMDHAKEKGLLRSLSGEENPNSTISLQTARLIKKRLREKERPTDIAKDLNLSVHIIRNIKRGNSWRDAE